MDPNKIRDQNVDTVLDTPLPYNRRSYVMISSAVGIAMLVSIIVLPLLRLDLLSIPGALIVLTSALLTAYLARKIYDGLQPPTRHYVVAFFAPRWDAQMANPIEVDTQDKFWFLDGIPALKIRRDGEWMRFDLKSGVTTYILEDDFKTLTAKPTVNSK